MELERFVILLFSSFGTELVFNIEVFTVSFFSSFFCLASVSVVSPVLAFFSVELWVNL